MCISLYTPQILKLSVRILGSLFAFTPCSACCLRCPLLHFHCLVREQQGLLTVASHTFHNILGPGPLALLNAPSGFASELFGGMARAGALLENLLLLLYIVAVLEISLEGLAPGTCRNECLFLGPSRCQGSRRRVWIGLLVPWK